MTQQQHDQDAIARRHAEAAELRRKARQDDEDAHRLAESDPTYAGYLQGRAEHRRWLANDLDGGAGQ